MIENFLIDYTKKLCSTGLHRQRRLINSDCRLNFSSNDYLSLTDDQRIKEGFRQGFTHYPTGSGGSMVVCGYHVAHNELEQAFSQALNADDALLFSSGYAANLGVISLLARLKGHLYIDKCLHASIYDGIQLSKIEYTRFLHNDLADLRVKLDSANDNSVVFTEAVFSMSGQMAPLSEMVILGQKHGAPLIVDEAHAFGIFGSQGLGAVSHQQLTQKEVPLRIIPFGKAFGCQGAMVVGQGIWIDALLQAARSHIYSTAVSPAMAYGLLKTLEVVQDADDRRVKLSDLIHYFQKKIDSSPLKWQLSITPIQQLQLGCPHRALYYTERLSQVGIFCQSMREPTVSKLNTGLRVILNYHHEPEDIDQLFSQLHLIYESEY